jgi:hypothetical protein
MRCQALPIQKYANLVSREVEKFHVKYSTLTGCPTVHFFHCQLLKGYLGSAQTPYGAGPEPEYLAQFE